MLLREVVRLPAKDVLDKTASVFPKYRVTTPGLGALDR